MAPSKVLLIGWDAADWEHIDPLLEQGLLPTLQGMIEQGVMGNLATLQPILSPMLWNSVATGKHAYKHGIHGFIEPDPDHGGARPYSSYSRKTHALWNILTHAGLRSNVVNWWASHPAEPILGSVITNAFNGIRMDPKRGVSVSPGTVHPADKAQFYAQFKVFPQELTGEHLLPFIPKAAELNQEEDSRLEMLAKVLAETATTQAIATAVLELEPWDFAAVYFTGIDHFSHGFMQYHPPRLPYIPERDFEMFKDVVTGAYRFHDMMLERLLQLAGPETTVILCSDHGFQSGPLRPRGSPREPAGPAAWHRRFGVLVAKGPNIRKDERVYGASLVDIAPTILAHYGLPIGEDMDGRPLLEMFEHPPEIQWISSWDAVEGEFGTHKERPAVDPNEAEELLNQFAALGYIDDPGKDKTKQAESAEVESLYNLARNYQWRQMYDEAIPIFLQLVEKYPWETRFIQHLAMALHAAGDPQQAIRLIEASYDITTTRDVATLLTWASAKVDAGQTEAGMEMLERIERTVPERVPTIPIKLGQAYLKVGRLADAERAFRRAIELHSENAEAFMYLSTVYRRLGRYDECVDVALSATSLIFRLPIAHLNLGIALARTGEPERAVVALENAVKFAPNLASAHRWLMVVHRSLRNDPIRAEKHRLALMAIREARRAQGNRSRKRRSYPFPLPEIPTEAERNSRLVQERPDRKDPKKRSGKTFILVSGLPRSGTSLMMQMLEAGGIPPKTDGERTADEDNPKGYYEWEAIKQVAQHPEILDEPELEGKVIKVISMLIERMPYSHDYKVIFMTRPIAEVVASQAKMIDRAGTQGSNQSEEELRAQLESHRDRVLDYMRRHPRMEVIEVDYPTLIAQPDEQIARLVEFLGERLPDPDRMRSAVDRSLYRNRVSTK